MTREKQKSITEFDHQKKHEKIHQLILLNDNQHTFDYVIDTLVDVCQHTEEQATQCTLITHYIGKCDIKRGNISDLRPIRKALTDKELKTIIC